jgi:hypothetical protein
MSLALPAGIVTGSDNVLIGATLGLLPLTTRRRAAYALAFAAAESGMTLAGYAVAVRLAGSDVVPTVALAAAGALVLVACWRRADAARFADHPAAVVLLPLILSFDNLAAGAGLSASVLPTALGAGLVSAALAAGAMWSTGGFARSVPRHAPPLAGMLLLALAASRWVEALS